MDAHKCVTGLKRQLIVDTQGRLWRAGVHSSNQAVGSIAMGLIGDLLWRIGERLEKVYGDQVYKCIFARSLADWSIDIEKASRPESIRGLVPIIKHWEVARTIAWTNRTRDLVFPAIRTSTRYLHQ